MKTYKSWFYRLLLSYLPIFFVVGSVILILSFLFMNQLSQRQAKSANELFAQTEMTAIDQSLKSIDYEVMQDIETDSTLTGFFKSDTYNYYMNYQVAQKLNGWINSHPLIDSAYVVRWRDGLVITPTGLIPLADFADRAFLLEQKSRPLPFFWTDIRTIALKATDSPESIISLARKAPILSGNQGIVVIDVKTKSLEQLIKDSGALKFGFLAIRGNNNQLILNTDTASDYSASSITTIAKSSYTGWEFLSGVKDYRIFSYTSLFSYVWIALGLIVTLIGGILDHLCHPQKL